MEYSDFDLVRGIHAGDKSALDILVRRWYPRIYGYSLKLIGNEQDAYDITQDVLIAMMRNLKSYRPWKKFDHWILTIAHHKCIDYFRLQKKNIPIDDTAWEQPDPAQTPEEAVTVSIPVREALARLPAAQREAVILHYFHQFTAREIAGMTGTPLPTVKSRLSVGKKALAAILGEDFP